MLKQFYEKLIESTIEAIKTKYELSICTYNDIDYPQNINNNDWIVYKLKAAISSYGLITIVIAFPKIFPDLLPKIYLSFNDYKKLYPIPHVDINRFICVRDPEVILFNDNKPEEATLLFIEIALNEILEKGISGVNRDQITGEFLAYWNDNCAFNFLSIIPPPTETKIISLFTISKKIFNAKYIIAYNIEQVKDWLIPFNARVKEGETIEILNLFLSNPLDWPFPATTKEVFTSLENCDKNCISYLTDFLNKHVKNLIVTFSFYLKDEILWAGWKHISWPKEIIKGFRSINKVPIKLKLLRTENEPIDRIKIIRLDKSRLFKRVGLDIKNGIQTMKLAVVGCGSVGSHLCEGLIKSGYSDFLLIDKEELEVENTPRHICGMHTASKTMNKAFAVKDELINHFPYINCSAIDKDILYLLYEEEKLLNKYDLILANLGVMSVERRINKLAFSNVINSPIIYIWMEPFGIAGHLIYVNPNIAGCYNCCFTSDAKFKYAVAIESDDFKNREAGCQNTFVPYSACDIQQFTSYACRVIVDISEEQPLNNKRYTWIGNKKAFSKMGYSVHDKWISIHSYSTYEKIINKDNYCKICNK